MRIAPFVVFTLAACLTIGCGIEQISQGGGSAAKPADGGADAADAAVQGAGCGVESVSGAQLCVATSLCPTVAVDTQALPHCGFRIKGGSSELVCACGDAICSMGAYTTCAQAAQLLTSQTESQVCLQINEGRCTTNAPVPGSSGASSSGSPTCDRQCLQECGGGGGCASICGC